MTTCMLCKWTDMTFGSSVCKGSFCGVTSGNGSTRGLGRYAAVTREKRPPSGKRSFSLPLFLLKCILLIGLMVALWHVEHSSNVSGGRRKVNKTFVISIYSPSYFSVDAVIITSVTGPRGKQRARHFAFAAFLLASFFHRVESISSSRDPSLCSETRRLNSIHYTHIGRNGNA
jgi:hypothetical protein